MSHEPVSISDIAEWMRTVEATDRAQLSRGGVFCIELRDRSSDCSALGPDALRAIWSEIRQRFAGPAGLGWLGPERAFALTSDESQWTSLAACVVETAIQNGISAHDVGVGIGFARQEDRHQPTADILRLATSAASHASDTGVGFSSRSLADEERLHRSLTIGKSLQNALGGAEGMRLIFQPKVSSATGQIMGAESLLRLDCPELGSVSTLELLDVAEASGDLGRLDRWALGLAVESIASLFHGGGVTLPLSVNMRLETALERGFLEFVAATVKTFKVPANLLRIELREDEVLADRDRASQVMAGLNALGVTVALDGFGRVKSTLAELRDLPVQALKLDRGIVREMMTRPSEAQLAYGMMHLARVLQMETVAVGIETEEQRDALRKAGCTSLQGFLFYEPLAFDALLAAVRERPSVAA